MPSHCRKSSRPWGWLPGALLAWAGLASAAPAEVANHVVISEVVTVANTATNRPLCSEYVEIHNPTAAAIDLGQYYLTDGRFTSNNVAYWLITGTAPSDLTAGGGTFSDFHARFPTGYTIAAGDTVVVAIAGSAAYSAAYGRLPDFELFEEAAAPDGVPELVEVFPGSINAGTLAGGANTPTLTDNGESLVLYRWDGTSDLVQDVDYMRWGTSTTVVVDKTGVTMGAGTYLADTAAAGQQTVSATTLVFGNAYVRQSADEGSEALTAGNGLTGHNETSENFTVTWHTVAQGPPLAPGTPYAAAPIITAAGQIPATPVDGEAVTVTITALSATLITGTAFHYTVDGGADNVLPGSAAGDVWSATIPSQPLGAVVRWHAVATNAAGSSATYPDAAPRFVTTFTVIAPPPPVITAFGHSPAAPYADLPVTISVTATSISALSGAVFHYAVNGGAFAQLTGTAQSGGVYTATVPGQDPGAIVTWYVVVTNAAALGATSPADAPTSTHGWTVGAGPDPKLLLSEVCTLGSDQEFIEIWNPSTQNVDMSDYYLSDAIYAPANTGYWNMGGGVLSSNTVGGGAFTDFTARFPAGFTIPAGRAITVSIAGSALFTAAFGFVPDIELYEDDASADEVPDMRNIFAEPNNSIITLGVDGGVPGLTNTGEPVILYKWTAGADLVADIDIFIWGTATSYQFSKTGKTVGSSTYLPETATGQQTPFTQQLAFGKSYIRVDASEGTQVSTGSNGIRGSDELSENWNTTWEMLPSTPGQAELGGDTGGGVIELVVPAKTFLPSLGEYFPIRFVSKSDSETRLRLYDREGRLVRTLFDSRFKSPPPLVDGYRKLVWNGLDETFQEVNGGMYIVHLSVVDKSTGVEETRTAPVVVTTRLSR